MFGGIATTFAEKDLLYVNKVELRSCAGTTHNHYMCQRNGIHTHGKNKEVERGSILGLYFVCEAIYIYILYVKNETFYGRHFSRGYTTSIVCVTVSVCVYAMLCIQFPQQLAGFTFRCNNLPMYPTNLIELYGNRQRLHFLFRFKDTICL